MVTMSEVKDDQIRNNVRENYKKVALKVINNTRLHKKDSALNKKLRFY